MVRRVARAAVFAGLTLALFALARPARAIPAGLCDDRGATAVAPPPALEPPESALERTRSAQAPCGKDGPARATAAPSRRAPRPVAAAERALPAPAVLHAPPRALGVDMPIPIAPPHTREARFRVERPPRP
jgi:hypothetical protein